MLVQPSLVMDSSALSYIVVQREDTMLENKKTTRENTMVCIKNAL
jgi:hypothetical protein